MSRSHAAQETLSLECCGCNPFFKLWHYQEISWCQAGGPLLSSSSSTKLTPHIAHPTDTLKYFWHIVQVTAVHCPFSSLLLSVSQCFYLLHPLCPLLHLIQPITDQTTVSWPIRAQPGNFCVVCTCGWDYECIICGSRECFSGIFYHLVSLIENLKVSWHIPLQFV